MSLNFKVAPGKRLTAKDLLDFLTQIPNPEDVVITFDDHEKDNFFWVNELDFYDDNITLYGKADYTIDLDSYP